jgi:hypothetical protein
MSRIPVRIGQENQIKVITSFGAPGIPYLAVNATNVVGGIVTATSLEIDGTSNFLGDAYFSRDINVTRNLTVGGASYFIGTASFYGGTIGLGNTNTDDIIFGGEVSSDIVPNLNNTYSLGISTQRWSTLYSENLNINAAVILSGIGNTYGIAYFGPNSEIISTATPAVGIQTTNLLLTTNSSNVPVWADSIDGGFY